MIRTSRPPATPIPAAAAADKPDVEELDAADADEAGGRLALVDEVISEAAEPEDVSVVVVETRSLARQAS